MIDRQIQPHTIYTSNDFDWLISQQMINPHCVRSDYFWNSLLFPWLVFSKLVEEQVSVFWISFPFKCHKLLVAHADLIWALNWGFQEAENTPCETSQEPDGRKTFHGALSQAKGALPWGKASFNTTAPLCSALSLPRQVAAKATHARFLLWGRKPQPFQPGQTPVTSPLLTYSNQGQTVTFKTGWLALPSLATGTTHFIKKCSWLQNPRVIHLYPQPEI